MARKLIPESLDMSDHEADYRSGLRSWVVLDRCNWKPGERIPVIGAARSVIGVAEIVSHRSCFRGGPNPAKHDIRFNALTPIRLSNSLSARREVR